MLPILFQPVIHSGNYVPKPPGHFIPFDPRADFLVPFSYEKRGLYF